MLLTTEHVQLIELLDSTAVPTRGVTMREPLLASPETWHVLDLEGIVTGDPPAGYTLTGFGKETARLLRRMLTDGAMPASAEIERGWRFLGSEVLAALEAASRCNGQIGPLTGELLAERSMVETPNDFGMEIQHLRLNAYGRAWLDLSRRCCPRLEVTSGLAAALLTVDLSSAEACGERLTLAHLAQLEAMELLVWSVPDAESYMLTTLGQAVYDTLRVGTFPTSGMVLDAEVLRALARITQRGVQVVSPAQIEVLQVLGYLDAEGALTASGSGAMRVYALLRSPAPGELATFAISGGEVEILSTLRKLSPEDGDSRGATRAAIRGELVSQVEHAYGDSIGQYGGELADSRTSRKQAALATLEDLKWRDHTFASVRDAEDELLHLESLDLVRSDGSGRATTYQLTLRGNEVVDEQLGRGQREPRTITTDAVKAITWGGHHHAAPATAWIEAARAQGLLGADGITQSGHCYAALATSGVRRLTLTKREAHVLIAQGSPCMHSSRPVDEATAEALEHLETRGLIARQVDGQIVRTEAGEKLASAVAEAADLAYPVTASVVRLLGAMRQVGGVDPKERHLRIAPDQWREVERRSGLSREAFAGALQLARLAEYGLCECNGGERERTARGGGAAERAALIRSTVR